MTGAKWQQIYDSAEALHIRSRGGVIANSVCRAKDDPHIILVTHTFSSMAAAEAYVANSGLAEAMRQGGVEEGSLRLELYDEV